MDLSLCLQSTKPPMMSQTKPITSLISARMSNTKPLVFKTIITSKCNNSSIISPNDNVRAQKIKELKDGEVVSMALACATMGIFCFGAAMFVGAGKASAVDRRGWWPGGGDRGGVSSEVIDHDEQSNVLNRKDVIVSLSKTRRYWAALDSRATTLPVDLDIHKRNALKEIKRGKDIELALKEMKMKKNGNKINFKSDDPHVNYDIKMEAVQILIAQGNVDRALELLISVEKDFIPSDPRPSLYKAIIYSIRYDKNRPPDEHWDTFFNDESDVPNPENQLK